MYYSTIVALPIFCAHTEILLFMSHLVTIAIPTYNRADGFLQNVLNCALNQTYSNVEVLVCDNASEDATEKVMAEYLSKYDNLKYVRHAENMGAHANFNFAIKASGGRFVCLLHDDDAVDPEFVQCCVSAIDASSDEVGNIAIVRTGVRIIDEAGNVSSTHTIQRPTTDGVQSLINWANQDSSMYLCNTLFNREKLLEIGVFYSPKVCMQDIAANVILLSRHSCVEVSDALSSFRVHSNEMTFGLSINEWLEDSKYIRAIVEKEFGSEDRSQARLSLLRALERMALRRCGESNSVKERLSKYRSVMRQLGLSKKSLLVHESNRLKMKLVNKIF